MSCYRFLLTPTQSVRVMFALCAHPESGGPIGCLPTRQSSLPSVVDCARGERPPSTR